jgi:hypothetical protein
MGWTTEVSEFESRRGQEFSPLHVQIGFGVHPISYPMCTGSSFPGVKAAGTWSWPLHLVPRSRKCGSIHPLPHTLSWRSAYLVKHRDNFTFFVCFPCFEKKLKQDYDISVLSVCLCIPPISFWMAETNLYETGYVRVSYGTWPNLSGVLQKSLPLVYIYICPPSLLGNGWVKTLPL